MTICTTAGSRKHCGNTIALIGKGRDVKDTRRDFLFPEKPDARKSARDRIEPLKSQTRRTHPAKPVFQDTQLAVNLKNTKNNKTLGVDITKICCSHLGMLKNFFITTSTEKIAHC